MTYNQTVAIAAKIRQNRIGMDEPILELKLLIEPQDCYFQTLGFTRYL